MGIPASNGRLDKELPVGDLLSKLGSELRYLPKLLDELAPNSASISVNVNGVPDDLIVIMN